VFVDSLHMGVDQSARFSCGWTSPVDLLLAWEACLIVDMEQGVF
jgi:hypothetical protein